MVLTLYMSNLKKNVRPSLPREITPCYREEGSHSWEQTAIKLFLQSRLLLLMKKWSSNFINKKTKHHTVLFSCLRCLNLLLGASIPCTFKGKLHPQIFWQSGVSVCDVQRLFCVRWCNVMSFCYTHSPLTCFVYDYFSQWFPTLPRLHFGKPWRA